MISRTPGNPSYLWLQLLLVLMISMVTIPAFRALEWPQAIQAPEWTRMNKES